MSAFKPISSDYVLIKRPNLAYLRLRYSRVWKNNDIPKRQLQLNLEELKNYKKIPPMAAAVGLVKTIAVKRPKLLEIGCSSGYYNEVFKMVGLDVVYQGCDYSRAFIKLAKQRYPGITFRVCDATRLQYRDAEFDIAFSSGCLLHIINYQDAIKEAARVSKKYVIFHRTPILHFSPTAFTKKLGYGLEMLEILFNEDKLIELFAGNGLTIQKINTHGKFPVVGIDEPIFMKSYLCRKMR